MAEDPALNDLHQRQLAILKGRVPPARTSTSEERELAAQRYARSEASLRSLLSTVTLAVRKRKENLPTEYSEKSLLEESAWYQGLGELFYDMTSVRNHNLYEFVGRSSQRRRDALEVHRKAQAVSEHYERQSRNPRRYLQSATSAKLHQLIVALENM